MQNRLATAILMAMGGSLANLEKTNEISDDVSRKFLESVSDYTMKLLKGEEVQPKGDYPLMKLSGSNLAAQAYNDLTIEVLQASDPTNEIEGYKE